MSPRFSTMATMLRRQGPGRIGTPEEIVERARRAESEGFDVVCVADLGVAQTFPALTLAAQATERITISTRVLGVFTHSPVHFASGAAWIDRISGGRFALGLGASLPDFWEAIHGGHWVRPLGRMRDTLKLYRALFGEEVAGVSRNADGSLRYQGETLAVERALIDLPPTGPRPPVWIAASGPNMLRLAGAWADGVIIEYCSEGYLDWVWEQLRAGAAETGRSLDGFEVCEEAFFFTDVDDPELQARQQSWLIGYVNHCVWPHFDHIWRAAGLMDAAQAVRSAAQAGDQNTAETLVRERILPRTSLTGAPSPERFREWYNWHREAGVTMFAVPLDLKKLVGLNPREAHDVV